MIIPLSALAQIETKVKPAPKAVKSPAYAAAVPKPTLTEIRYGTHERHVLVYPGAPDVKHATATDFLIATLNAN